MYFYYGTEVKFNNFADLGKRTFIVKKIKGNNSVMFEMPSHCR